jgi:tetratricopeptide (TPR) repeat protein
MGFIFVFTQGLLTLRFLSVKKKLERDLLVLIHHSSLLMTIYKVLIINFLFLLMPLLTRAADAQQYFTEANQAYQAGNYTKAVEQYEAILKSGVFSSELHYNLGNAYYRLGQIGRAILNYERALRLSPSNSDIENNLTLAQARITENIEPVSQIFLIKWGQILRGWLAADSWSVLGLMFLWTGVAGFAIWLLGQERVWKKRGFLMGSILIPLSIIPFLCATSAKSLEMNTQNGIILVRETAIRPAPDANALPTGMLHEGIKVEIKDKIQSHIKVKLPNGEEGWIEEKGLEKI